MKQKLAMLAFTASVFCTVLLAFNVGRKIMVQPGQVWIYKTENPFIERTQTNIIVAIKSGYVQFDCIEPAWYGGGVMTNIFTRGAF